MVAHQGDGELGQQVLARQQPASLRRDRRRDPAQGVKARCLQPVVWRFRFSRPVSNDPSFALSGALRRRERSLLRLAEPERPAAATSSIGLSRRPNAGTKARIELLRNQRQGGAPRPLEQLRQLGAMGCDIFVENGRSDARSEERRVGEEWRCGGWQYRWTVR